MTSKGNLFEGSPRALQAMTTTASPFLLTYSEWREFVCGLGAAVVNITITFPLNKIIFRQMLHNVGVKGAVRQISKEGVLFLYRGIFPPLCQKGVSTSVMFGVYGGCRTRLLDLGVPRISSLVIAANIAGTMEASLAPFERLQTLMQHSQYHTEFKNSQHAIRVIWANYGFKEFYRGMVPILLRNGPSNVFFFLMREEGDRGLPKPESMIGKAIRGFFIGAVIGAFTSTVFYPLNVIKVHVQSRLGGPYQTTWEAVREIYHERDGSLRKFYRGVHMNYTRSFISWGIINVAYDKLRELLSYE